MSEIKRNPWSETPWFAIQDNDGGWSIYNTPQPLHGTAITGWGSVRQTEEDAKRIVECVNGYEQLCQRNAELARELADVQLSYLEQAEKLRNVEAELARLCGQEPIGKLAYTLLRGWEFIPTDKEIYNLHLVNIYAEPKPAQEIPDELIEWANNFESVFGTDDEDMVSEKITRNVCRDFVCDQLAKMKGK
jgi:hypothetical protein